MWYYSKTLLRELSFSKHVVQQVWRDQNKNLKLIIKKQKKLREKYCVLIFLIFSPEPVSPSNGPQEDLLFEALSSIIPTPDPPSYPNKVCPAINVIQQLSHLFPNFKVLASKYLVDVMLYNLETESDEWQVAYLDWWHKTPPSVIACLLHAQAKFFHSAAFRYWFYPGGTT